MGCHFPHSYLSKHPNRDTRKEGCPNVGRNAEFPDTPLQPDACLWECAAEEATINKSGTTHRKSWMQAWTEESQQKKQLIALEILEKSVRQTLLESCLYERVPRSRLHTSNWKICALNRRSPRWKNRTEYIQTYHRHNADIQRPRGSLRSVQRNGKPHSETRMRCTQWVRLEEAPGRREDALETWLAQS